jgi:hypothetical protein
VARVESGRSKTIFKSLLGEERLTRHWAELNINVPFLEGREMCRVPERGKSINGVSCHAVHMFFYLSPFDLLLSACLGYHSRIRGMCMYEPSYL